jgi:ribosome assembly protein YihI (activator of Der GTPase)
VLSKFLFKKKERNTFASFIFGQSVLRVRFEVLFSRKKVREEEEEKERERKKQRKRKY